VSLKYFNYAKNLGFGNRQILKNLGFGSRFRYFNNSNYTAVGSSHSY